MRIAKQDCCMDAVAARPLAEVPEDAVDHTAEQLAALAWAVAHLARVRILRMLIRQQACVCGEIVDQLPLAQSTVSQHLKILKESGLIQGEVAGPKVCYCINPQQLQQLKSLVAAL